jgi:hypothetical protein
MQGVSDGLGRIINVEIVSQVWTTIEVVERIASECVLQRLIDEGPMPL